MDGLGMIIGGRRALTQFKDGKVLKIGRIRFSKPSYFASLDQLDHPAGSLADHV